MIPRKDVADTINAPWTFAENVWFNKNVFIAGNLSYVNVQTLNVNGSLIPIFNNMFDIGNSSNRWRDANFAGSVNTNNLIVSGYVNSNLIPGSDNSYDLGSSTNKWRNIFAYNINGGTPITGSGSANYVAKFTGSNTLGNSIIYDTGTSVGIGTSSPGAKLDVAGDIALNDNPLKLRSYSDAFHQIDYSTSIFGLSDVDYWNYNSYLVFSQGTSNPRVTITGAGNVGIGTTNPVKKLDVVGDVNATNAVYSTNGYYIGSYQVIDSNRNIVNANWVNATNLNASNTVYATVIRGTTIYQGANQVIDTINANAPLSSSKTGGSVTISLTTPLALNYGGTGADLSTAGNYIIVKSGSSLAASPVDLASGNFTGVLPLSKGGTGASLTANAGGIVYSTSSALAISSPGTSGQVLVSGGTGAPSWTSSLSLSSLTMSGNINMGANSIVGANWVNGTNAYFTGTIYGNIQGSITPTGNINMQSYSIYNAYDVNATRFFQGSNRVIDTITAGNGLTGGGSGPSVNLDVNVNTAKGLQIVNDALETKIGTGLNYDGSGNIYVVYGNTAGTAVQGNTQLTINTGTGLTGGTTITLGSGGTVNLGIDNTYVPFKGNNEQISGSWTFLNDLTVMKNLRVAGNITYVNAQTLNVNGSLIPPLDNWFDIGNSSNRWRNASFAGSVNTNNLIVSGYVNSNLIPGSDNSYNLGSSSNRWANLYAVNVYASNINGGTPITGSGASGQVAFFTGTNTIGGSNNLYWDNTNARLGIGTNLPQQNLDVVGNVNVTNNLYVSGNIGIGTNNPQARLDIEYLPGNQGTIAIFGSTSRIRIIDEGSGLPSGIAAIGPTYGLGLYAASGPMRFFTGGTTSGYERMRIDTTGNIGIGTTSPTATLHISSTNPAGAINIVNTTTGNSLLFVNATSGNVGIGTTTPVSALTIRGFSGGTGGDPLAGYTRNLVIGGPYNQPYNSGNATLLEIRDYSNDAGDNVYPIFVADENSNIDFFLKAGTTNSNSNAIAYFGGNVGIGIMSPSEKLEVSGNIKLSGYINVAGSYIRKTGSSIVISDV